VFESSTRTPTGNFFPCTRVPSAVRLPRSNTVLAFAECRVPPLDRRPVRCCPDACCGPGASNASCPVPANQSRCSGGCHSWGGAGRGATTHVDTSDRYVCLRRSTDGGRTFAALQENITSMRSNNPSAVVSGTNDVLLFFNQACSPTTAKPGCGGVWLARSTDLGASWSAGRKIWPRPKVPPPHVSIMGPGTGATILPSGRIAVAMYAHYTTPTAQTTGVVTSFATTVIFSDDETQSWSESRTMLPFLGEPQLVVFPSAGPDGLMLNARCADRLSYHGKYVYSSPCVPQGNGSGGYRGVALSTNGGESFKPAVFPTDLRSPGCQGSTILLSDGSLAYAGDDSRTSRHNMTLKITRALNTSNAAFTFPPTFDAGTLLSPRTCSNSMLEPCGSGYSAVFQAADGRVGVLWEGGSTRCNGSSCAIRLSMVDTKLPPALKTDDILVLEAENFSLAAGSCWRSLPWGDNAYASTFLAGGSTFLSRKAFLGAPAAHLGLGKGGRCVASATARITVADIYAPLVRFEALCRRPACFETQFEVTVAQAGVVKFTGVYGATDTLDLTGGPSAPSGGTGVTRNKLITNAITWQGAYNRTLPLSIGEVTVTLVVSDELTPPNSGPRNIDVVVLTRDFADLAVRLAHGGQHGNTPLDGMLTQESDVFLRLRNHAAGVHMSLNVPFAVEHSNYWTHLRFPSANGTNAIPPLVLSAAPGTVSRWYEAGSRLDSLNDGEWSLQAAPQDAALRHRLHYAVDVAVDSGNGVMSTIASFNVSGCPYFEPSGQTPCETKLDYDKCFSTPLGPIISNACPLVLAFDSNTRATKRIRRAEEQLENVMTRVRRHQPNLPPSGRPPNSSRVVVSCTNCFVNSSNLGPQWNASATEFRKLYGLRNQHEDDLDSPSSTGCDGKPFAYRSLGPVVRPVCWTGIYANASQCLDTQLAAMSPATKECVAVASLGDEITIPPILSVPGGAAEASILFVSWAQKKGLLPLDIGCAGANWSNCQWDTSSQAKQSNPAGYYWSSIWSYEWAALQMRQFTELVAAHLPNAAIGANFAPADFCSESWKWIDVFRASALTMPWAEGYTFAFDGPLLGTPQMVELRQEMLRSGVSRVTDGLVPGRLNGQILFYVTNQWPGQSPNAWKRQFYAALAHHVKGIDLYEMHSSLGALENYIQSDYPEEQGTYEVILSSMWELGQIDDIVAASPSQGAPAAEVAMYFSTAADAWGDNDAFGEWGTT
jgi:hypothetical protein